MNAEGQLRRNAGPSWGIQFLARAQQTAPRWLLWPALKLGNWVAVARMPAQRRNSREFLRLVLDREPTLMDVWRHFFSFLELLMLRLRLAGGGLSRCELAGPFADEFEALMNSGEPALFGTFHFGHSDLLGFLLPQRGRRVAMVRLQLANSPDTRMLEEAFAGRVSFVWIREPAELLFALKAALERGDSVALQCDRLEFAAKTETFDFLGARRRFPFTIYHLAIMFGRPVMFCIGMPDGADGTTVIPSPLFRPDPAIDRRANLDRACVHFQAVLARLEALVRQHPLLWFNFLPLTSESPPAPVPSSATRLPAAGPIRNAP
jgi:predicted LPLAT superfamily acyltransferase